MCDWLQVTVFLTSVGLNNTPLFFQPTLFFNLLFGMVSTFTWLKSQKIYWKILREMFPSHLRFHLRGPCPSDQHLVPYRFSEFSRHIEAFRMYILVSLSHSFWVDSSVLYTLFFILIFHEANSLGELSLSVYREHPYFFKKFNVCIDIYNHCAA